MLKEKLWKTFGNPGELLLNYCLKIQRKSFLEVKYKEMSSDSRLSYSNI